MSDESGSAIGFDERALVRETAKRRNSHFANKPSNRPLSNGYEEVGTWGEWEFAKFSGIMMRLGKGGDGGVDFTLPVYFTVDVKTSRKGDFLLVEVGKVKADIYVLVHYEEVKGCLEPCLTLVGWATAQDLLSVPPKDSGRGVVNHAIAKSQLRPMDELKRLMTRK